VRGEEMKNKRITIPLRTEEGVSGILSVPEDFRKEEGTGVIIAHGAGKDMNHPLLEFFAEGLAHAGYLAMRFNFPYKEKGKKAPDPKGKLEKTWISVVEFLLNQPDLSLKRIFAAGKSMGGRIASQLIAEGRLPVEGLVLLGYPLHPPGRKEKLRDAHLSDIRIPMLYFAGTRDPLCDLTLLKSVLKKLDVDWDLDVIEGGDHSFKLLKSSGIPEEEVFSRLVNKTISWLKNRH
jgi:predicted alpha/beta-hydrolase family hydrolase